MSSNLRALAAIAVLAACGGGTDPQAPCGSCAPTGDGSTDASAPGGSDARAGCTAGCDAPDNPPPTGATPRLVAYVNCLCGFGAGANGGVCLADPDPTINHVKAWEDAGTSPITHYVISFLSFQSGSNGIQIRTDPGEIWNNPNGSTTDFALAPTLRDAMAAAKAHGKKVYLSIGGEVGSTGFLAWRNAVGVAGMRSELARVAKRFAEQNAFAVDGYDVDIELGGYYGPTTDKYLATRDLINAVPPELLVAFVPQVGNGLCAAPNVNDALDPQKTLGGQCQQPNNDDAPWVLARLDHDCTRADGTPRLDYYGIQYYNAGQADCCGGGSSPEAQVVSTAQNYANLSNGWPAFGDPADPKNPWFAYRFFPGPWAAFSGFGADRVVLGKPGCQGCAGSNYLSLADMANVLAALDHRLDRPIGGILFWDLCRLFGNTGAQCVSGTCQPSWGARDVLANLTSLRDQMRRLHVR
jgi:hypothetical protein